MKEKNPWRGLASYDEPQGNENDYLFCGRNEETMDMVRLVYNNLFTTLYGSSGIGKTSLLKAGVMPILKRTQYYPIYVRLSQRPDNEPFARSIVNMLRKSGLREERSRKLEFPKATNRLFLWNYFVTTQFKKNDQLVCPVIILDQFEEVFRGPKRDKAILLLRQIYLLLNNELEIPREEGYHTDNNFRFIASLREDNLFILEDCIDEYALDLFKNNRYRLRPMKPDNAKQAVLIPGKNCIKQNEAQEVAKKIIDLSGSSFSEGIDPLMLSMICAFTFDKFGKIELADLDKWGDNPMQYYYKEAILNLDESVVQLIRALLIDQRGNRTRINSQELKNKIGDGIFENLTNGMHKILNRIPNNQVELIHDQLANVIFDQHLQYRNGIFMELQSRLIAEKARRLIEDGNHQLALRLLLEVLPDKNNPIEYPYTNEAEYAFRKAHHHVILKGHNAAINSIAFSPDGKSIVSASNDKTIRVWDVATGSCQIQGYSAPVNSSVFSPDGRSIVSALENKTISVWNVFTNKIDKPDKPCKHQVKSIVFTPDGNHFATVSNDGSIWMWDYKTFEYRLFNEKKDLEGEPFDTSSSHTLDTLKQSLFEETLRKLFLKDDIKENASKQSNTEVDTKEPATDTFFAQCIAFNPKGTKLASAYDYYKIRLWDTKSGQHTDIITEHEDKINSVSFSPDGIWLVTASDDKTVRVFHLDHESIDEEKVLKESGQINSAYFSRDGQLIVTASSDDTVRIWDANSFKELRIFKGFDSFKSAIFSPDGQHIAASSQDNTIHIWGNDMITPEIIENIITPDVHKVTFNQEGDQLIIHYGTQKIKVWDLTNKCIIDSDSYDNESTRLIKKEQIETFAICHDGKYAAKVLHDNSIVIIDNTTNREIDSLEGHTDTVFSINFSPDGKRLVSASKDGTIRIWPFHSLQDLIDQTRERFKDQPLTPEERRLYYLE